MRTVERESRLHLHPPPADLLVGVRGRVAQFARRSLDHQVAVFGHADTIGALIRQADTPCVRPRPDDEAVLQFPHPPGVHQVHPRVELAIGDLAVGGDVGAPLGRVVADEVVDPRRFGFCAHHLHRRVGVHEPEPQGGLAHGHHQLLGSEEDARAPLLHVVLDALVRLPLVGDEVEGQLPVGFQGLLLEDGLADIVVGGRASRLHHARRQQRQRD